MAKIGEFVLVLTADFGPLAKQLEDAAKALRKIAKQAKPTPMPKTRRTSSGKRGGRRMRSIAPWERLSAIDEQRG